VSAYAVTASIVAIQTSVLVFMIVREEPLLLRD